MARPHCQILVKLPPPPAECARTVEKADMLENTPCYRIFMIKEFRICQFANHYFQILSLRRQAFSIFLQH